MLYRPVLQHKHFRYLGAFYLHAIIRMFAVSIFQMFNSIYVFDVLINQGVSVPHTLGITSLIVALVCLIHALFIAPTLWLINKKGLRFSTFWGNMALIGYFALLYLGKFDPIFLR